MGVVLVSRPVFPHPRNDRLYQRGQGGDTEPIYRVRVAPSLL